MTFLELCQRCAMECGVSGSLLSVQNQNGELDRIVKWVSTAYDDICSRHQSWRFLLSSFSLTTTASQQKYNVTDFTDVEVSAVTVGFAHWWRDTMRIYRASAGIATQTFLPFTDYEDFRDIWLIGTQVPSQPITFTVRPEDEAVVFGPTPNDAYVVTGDFQRDANVLNDNGDVPLFPARFHMAIVWLAAQRYAGYEEATGLYQHADREYKRLTGALDLDQLPKMRHAGPLA